MKKICILISVLLISCAENIAIKNLAVTSSFPEEWEYAIPSSTQITGKWWEAFQDSILDKVFIEFYSNGPDIKIIKSRLGVAKQVHNIN